MARFMWIPKYGPGHERRRFGFLGRDAYDVSVEPRDLHGDADGDGAAHGDCEGMRLVRQVLADPPSTWAQYMDRQGGHWRIVEMEEAELQAAHTAMKAGSKAEKSAVRELSHVAAACVSAINAIMEKK